MDLYHRAARRTTGRPDGLGSQIEKTQLDLGRRGRKQRARHPESSNERLVECA